MGRGQLRIYLGAAPGVGKTYAMLNEGHRRRERGADVVVGYLETHGRERTAAQIGDLPVVARARIDFGSNTFEEMDTDALVDRAPAVALVDDLAHANAAGCRNEKRWQDVHELLAAGIDVISTLNIQHLESLNDVVETITGVAQREPIPDEIVRAAEQIELVDMTPEAIRRRMAHGNIYAPDEIDAALASYFRPGNLGALRELALLWVADRVDEALQQYRIDHDIDRLWETRERIVVALTSALSGEALIRRAARVAERARGDLIGVHVRAGDGRRDAPSTMLEHHRQLLSDLGGEYHELVADDVVVALVDFARHQNATQLVLGSSRRSRWNELTRGSVINRVVRHTGDIDIHVISTTPDDTDSREQRVLRAVTPLPAQRRHLAWALAPLGTALMTVALTSTRGTFGQGSYFLLYLLVVLMTAVVGGVGPAITAAVLASGALNWYFTAPLYTWTIDDAEDVLALVVFLIAGVLVGILVTTLARRSADARRGHAEAEALARIAAGMVGADDPIPPMLERIRTTLGIDGISVHTTGDEAHIAIAGKPPDPRADRTIELSHGTVRICGDLGRDDERILSAFVAQLTGTLERRTLREEAARAEALAEADNLRTAILRAVSHDLRTPLASIKASVTSLLQGDVAWNPGDRREFLSTIDEEADRLDSVIGNLLDASRLEAGSIAPATRHVALDDVVPAALASISGLDAAIQVDISPELPLVLADPGLLERAIANIVANGVAINPVEGEPVRISASKHRGLVELRVADHGPGVSADQRDQMFQPFQRLGDTAAGTGVGLGLAVARGIIEAMGGTLHVEDTPSGGLTMVVALPAGCAHD